MRLIFFVVDMLASAAYDTCRINCMGLFPPPLAPPPSYPPSTPPAPPTLPPFAPPYTPLLPPSPQLPPLPPGLPPSPPPAYPDEPPDTQCEVLLALIATVNCFSLCAFALIVLVRYLSKERSYKEACVVTYVLVALNLLLQLADATLPMVLTSNCFADTWLPPFNTTLMTLNCVRPCMLGDLYAAYALYALGKTCVGACDMYLSTGFLIRRPQDWYRTTSMQMSRLK